MVEMEAAALTYTVVVPVYNVRDYLSECLESVLRQTSTSGFEILLVDDGSTDGSGALCDEWAAKDARIRIIHQKNAGVSRARNVGIEAAGGKYILFLDSDDMWGPELLASMDEAAEQEYDMTVFCYQQLDGEGQLGSVCGPALFPRGESGAAYLQALFAMEKEPIPACWLYCYRRAFLIDNNLRFKDGLMVSEDWDFNLGCLSVAETVWGIEKVLYQYRIREGSCTWTPDLKKWRQKLEIGVFWFRRYPVAAIANGYCQCGVEIAALGTREETREICDFFNKNRDIWGYATDKKVRLFCFLFSCLGSYTGSAVCQGLLSLKKKISCTEG